MCLRGDESHRSEPPRLQRLRRSQLAQGDHSKDRSGFSVVSRLLHPAALPNGGDTAGRVEL